MSFLWNWIWEKLSGIIKTPTEFEGLDKARVDNQVGEKIVRNRRKVPAKKSNTSAKPARIRSDNSGKTGGKSTGKTVRATAAKGKAKSKAIPKG
jgi:hypothetical protein